MDAFHLFLGDGRPLLGVSVKQILLRRPPKRKKRSRTKIQGCNNISIMLLTASKNHRAVRRIKVWGSRELAFQQYQSWVGYTTRSCRSGKICSISAVFRMPQNIPTEPIFKSLRPSERFSKLNSRVCYMLLLITNIKHLCLFFKCVFEVCMFSCVLWWLSCPGTLVVFYLNQQRLVCQSWWWERLYGATTNIQQCDPA